MLATHASSFAHPLRKFRVFSAPGRLVITCLLSSACIVSLLCRLWLHAVVGPPAPSGGTLIFASRAIPRANAVILPTSEGITQFASLPCQNVTASLSDVTVAIVSSHATLEQRLPPLLDTWVRRAEDAGAHVVVLNHGAKRTGSGSSGGGGVGVGGAVRSVAAVALGSRLVPLEAEPGAHGCASPPAGHCHAAFQEQLRALLRASRGRGLVLRVDDDTVVHPGRLLSVLRCLPPSERFLLGSARSFMSESRPFATGGAGLLFPASMLEDMIARAADSLDATRADDVLYTHAALAVGGTLVNHEGFNQEAADMWDRGPRDGVQSTRWITHHHVAAEEVHRYFILQ